MVGVCEVALVGNLPSACGGRGWCMWREAAIVALALVRHLTMVLHFCSHQGFLHECSQLWSSLLPSPQAVSSQPTAVPSPDPLFIPHLLAPSPRAHQQTPVSGWGAQGCGMNNLCRSQSVLPATDLLLGSPLSL